MSITYKVAEYIIKHGKVNPLDIEEEFKMPFFGCVKIIQELEKLKIISPIESIKAKQITTSPRRVLITDLDKVKLLLTEVVEPEILKSNKK